MKCVVDPSVCFKWAVVEPFTPEARRLRDQYSQGIHDLLAPDVFPIEIAHALTRAERQGRISPAEGAQFLRDIRTMRVNLPESTARW